MKKTLLLASMLTVICSLQVQAFTQATHKRIVLDAIKYMKAHPDSTQYNKIKQWADKLGISVNQLAETLAQGAYDVDDFEDTFLCGAITGSCVQAPVWGLAESIVKYTSYWHFQNHTQGADEHGNDLGGYNYDKLTVWGNIDTLAATWLKGDYLDDGNGGETGWFNSDKTKYDSYGVTEAQYRINSQSNYEMYDDFEKIPFQPIDNLGQYWYQQFINTKNPQLLGFVFHTTDLLQPHHTWTTSDKNHAGWESWVNDYYDQESLADESLITQALTNFTPLDNSDTDIRPLLTEGGAISYSQGGIVLNSQAHYDRVQVGRTVIPNAIAMVIHLLNHSVGKV